MHIGDFLAVGNGYTCEGNRPRMPCMHAGKKPGETSALGRRELVSGFRRDDCVRYVIVRHDEWWLCLLVEDIFVMLIMQVTHKPPESTVDRVLFQ